MNVGPGTGAPHIAGVDAGQSSTVAAIADAVSGRELARGVGPPADLVGEPAGSTRQAGAIAASIEAALASAALSRSTPLAAIVVGLTGFEEGDAAPSLPFPGARMRVVHDTLTAHAGALGGTPGIVTIAGTGSVVFGTDAAGGQVRAGGWGFLFGDEGSAFAIGRAAIAEAMHVQDADGTSAVGRLVAARFPGRSLRALQAGYAAGMLGRPEIAALARGVVELSVEDTVAEMIVRGSLAGLAATVRSVHRRLAPDAGPRPVSYAGGLFKSSVYAARFRAFVTGLGSPLEVVEPKGDGVDGAVRLAVRLAAGLAERR